MPDAAMRELAGTGWINFRLRQLVTSYGIQLLQLSAHEVGGALAEGLSVEVIVRDDRIRTLVPFEPLDFETAVQRSLAAD